jgi:hypothetical protein
MAMAAACGVVSTNGIGPLFRRQRRAVAAQPGSDRTSSGPSRPCGAICPALPPSIDRARSVLRRIDGRAHGVHHLWSRGRLLRSVLIPWSASHDAEPRSRMRPSGFDYHGLACLRPET